MQHVLNLNVDCDPDPDPGDAFADILIKKWVGTPYGANNVVNGLMADLRPLFSTTQATFTHAELWKFTAGTFEASYISTYDISLAGLTASTGVQAQQSIYSFRTTEGGIMMVSLQETIFTGNSREAYADMNADQKECVDHFIEDVTSYWLGRDTSRPVVFLRHSPGQSEATFKKRFRP